MNRRPTLNAAITALKLVSLACSTYVAVAQLRALRSETAEDTPEHAEAHLLAVDDGDTMVFVPDGRYKVANAVIQCNTCDGDHNAADEQDIVLVLHGEMALADFNGAILDHDLKVHGGEPVD